MLYDCFTFFDELDLLDVRLHELHSLVDYFVLVEARQTFQGNPKPLYYADNADRFRRYADKIIHIVIDFPGEGEDYNLNTKPLDGNWAREHYQRNQIARGLGAARPDDLVILSDVDEIVSETALRRALAERSPGELTFFEMPVYRGCANRRVKGVTWDKGPRLIEYERFPGGQRLRIIKAAASKRFRKTTVGALHTRAWNWLKTGVAAPIRVMPDAGWHITSLGNWEAWHRKISAYSHAVMKKLPSYESKEAYAAMIDDETEVVDIGQLPVFIQRHPERFALA